MSVAAAPLAQEIMVPAESALAVSALAVSARVRLVPASLGQVPMSAGSLVRLDQPRHRPNREAHIPYDPPAAGCRRSGSTRRRCRLRRVVGYRCDDDPRHALTSVAVTASATIALNSGVSVKGEDSAAFARRLRWRHRGRLSNRVP